MQVEDARGSPGRLPTGCPWIRLGADGLLAAWEAGVGVHPTLRVAAVASAVWAGEPLPAHLPVGGYETVLLALRVGTFGPRAAAVVGCPRCEAQVELTVDAADVLGALPSPDSLAAQPLEVDVPGTPLLVRLPTPGDLYDVAAIHAASPITARHALVARCVRSTSGEPPSEADVASAAAVAEAADPAADIRLRAVCPDCSHGWSTPWPVGTFVWEELEAVARGLLAEVDELAARYGWREADILAMSVARRRAYLELV